MAELREGWAETETCEGNLVYVHHENKTVRWNKPKEGHPDEWSCEDKGAKIKILHPNILRFVGNEKIHNMIRTTEPVPNTVKSFYFEAKILDSGSNKIIVIGFTQSDPETRSGCLPGWAKYPTLGIGYHGDDGGICFKSSTKHLQVAEKFETGDTVGCFLYQNSLHGMEVTQVQFTKNGEKVLDPMVIENGEWHPTIGMASPFSSVLTNFGERPFAFDLEDEEEDE